jgi:IS1 family transposase
MNRLPLAKRAQILNLLVEGNSIRATCRITGASKNTVTKLLVDAGRACQKFHDEKVVGVKSKRVQCDEIWSFVYAKEKNVPDGMEDEAGDVWTWTALDADSKLIVSWFVGDRSADSANIFMQEVAGRISGTIQLTTDGHKPYLEAVEDAFVGIDYAMLVKIYGPSNNTKEARYSPAECIGAEKRPILGNPDPKHISTSYVERQNLTMRMHMRRFTRLTNAFSKKLENHCHAIALHFVYYNWCKIHKTLRVTPAMEAGLTDDVMEISDIVKLIDRYEEESSN